MNALLGRLKVRNKIMLLVVFMACALVVMQAWNLSTLWKNLNQGKQQELVQLTDTAFSLIDRQVQLVAAGGKSQQQGIADALTNLEALRYGDNDYFFVLNKKTEMLMHPIKPALNGQNVAHVKDNNGVLLMQEMVSNASRDGEAYVRYQWERAGSSEPVDKMSYSRLHPQWGLIVGTGIYIDDINTEYVAELRNSIITLALMLIAASTIGVILSRAIANPIIALKDVIVKASENHDLTLRSNIHSRDEVGQMAETFNEMLDSFERIITEVANASALVSTSACQLSAATLETQSGMQEQKQETIQVATAVTEMTATVHDVANNTESAASSSHAASQAASHGKLQVQEAVTAVNALASRLDQAGELTTQLNEESANIASILEVINKIADQTNLLALNAAIEAARAGEQGRGFAVVADEVRTLAQRTAESTHEIQEVIISLQQGSKNAANAMTESHTAAIDVVDKAGLADSALDDIVLGVSQIDDMTTQIASAAEEQSAVTEEISANVVRISEVSEACAASSDQIAGSSEELAALSEQLKSITAQFKVSG
ncbi:MAG: methyl-accepting chemotaxis protein [Motiliproteus sp.]